MFRWAHAECDGLASEDDAKLACSMTYHCALCRPKTKHLGIYSSLKTSVITKLSIRKALGTNSATPANNNRKTKTLHTVKSNKLTKAALREQRKAELEAMPLVPHNALADELGRVDIDLNNLKQRLRCDDTMRERLHLTDSGLKTIKAQVIRAPPVRKGRKKDDSKGGLSMPEDVTYSVDSADDIGAQMSLEKADTSFDTENDILSPEIKTEEDLDLIQGDTTAETDDLLDDTQEENTTTVDPEDTTDPVSTSQLFSRSQLIASVKSRDCSLFSRFL